MIKDKPCIVQRDRTILLEVEHSGFEEAREQLSRYADLVKSPSSFHTYRITPLSLWNAVASGWNAEQICGSLQSLSRFDVPSTLLEEILRLVSRYGQLTLLKHPEREESLILRCEDEELMHDIKLQPSLSKAGLTFLTNTVAEVPSERRGMLKQELTRLGYPVMDYAGYQDGQFLRIHWQGEAYEVEGPGRLGTNRLYKADEASGETKHGQSNRTSFRLRDYQQEAAEAFRDSGGKGGSGVLVLPCGAGKTVIGMAAMRELQCETLILTSNTTSVRQWMSELQEKTSLQSSDIGEYTGQRKEVRPVTVATYQILTHRHNKEDELRHMKLFNERSWGLIIYDEVHLLPAPVFRATADIQATRRLGLTATLVREDGREHDVFSLIGPKRYEMPWKTLEEKGWIATVDCAEVRVPMTDSLKEQCHYAGTREQYRLASENPAKMDVVKRLLERHSGAQTLIIGQYLNQLDSISREMDIPLISGQMPQHQRNELYAAFRRGDQRILVVSKVANFAVDLPDASVAIEISGSFGSRQEEAQRLGRILRPKAGDNKAYFYALVSQDSREEVFALRRQLFLIEQGYQYRTVTEPSIGNKGSQAFEDGAEPGKEAAGTT
ncbi:DNA excision repair protein ERCC-3 [Paenibacillus uliginis N3/975]|uniref:DNA 3'-5' helicase n=1 Tax=Paenibacillus uliginis N3/975 TaxID=1313296 RepID=A0A1X7HJW2_9BACL|nr:DNA repair helicase XPB [Paenibacillus uliginis]SMF87968.1 DNA excision repair protein ERCC-3 [Paenibacillus uliginis N3/975]